MTRSDLYRKIKVDTFAELVRQTDIQTDADRIRLRDSGYSAELTESEFRDCFTVDPRHIWYSRSLSTPIIYYNEDTFAACLFPIPHFGKLVQVSKSYEEIQHREQLAAEGDYFGSIMYFPDAMRLEYFEKLIAKGHTTPGLYPLFISIYKTSAYGFDRLTLGTIEKIVSLKSDKERAATEEALRTLPDVVTVYRGGGSESTDYRKAFSWTTDPRVALFFMGRLGTDGGYIVEGTVRKQAIIELILSQNEQEVILPPGSVAITEVITMYGMALCRKLIPVLTAIYQRYRDRMLHLDFSQISTVHGKEHEARVLLLCLMLAELEGLPVKERKILAEAAIYHDTKRTDDGLDPGHGRLSADYYASTVKTPNPLVALIIQYHCLPDEEGHAAIDVLMSGAGQEATALAHLCYDVFKDADALDRVRFGLRDLDIRFLRTKEAKALPLVARILLEQIKL